MVFLVSCLFLTAAAFSVLVIVESIANALPRIFEIIETRNELARPARAVTIGALKFTNAGQAAMPMRPRLVVSNILPVAADVSNEHLPLAA